MTGAPVITPEPIVSLRNVTVRLGDLEVLKEVSVDFPAGRSTVVVGPSGSGKSILLKVAAGIIIPDEGEVAWNGRPLDRIRDRELASLRQSTGFVFQDAALWANKSVAENLSLPLRVHNPRVSAAELGPLLTHACEELGFTDPLDSRPSQLSTGEQKMVAFMRATIGAPSLLFADEPTASVDHAVADRMLGVIRRLKEAGSTMIVVTHSSKLAAMVADSVVVLRDGALLVAGPTAEVIRSARREVREILAEVLAEAAVYDTDLLDLLGQKP